MKKGIKVRLLPTKEQEELLKKCIGCSRFAFNWAKDRSDNFYLETGKTIPESDLRKDFTKLKNTREYNWLNEVPVDVTKQAIIDFCTARRNFFKGLSERPSFKKKVKIKGGFYNDVEKIFIKDGKVRLSKLGWIEVSKKTKNLLPYYSFNKTKRKFEGTKIFSPRISYDGYSWSLSISIEVVQEEIDLNENKTIGIDLGLKTFACICIKEKEGRKVKYKYKKFPSKKKQFKKLEAKRKLFDRKVSKAIERRKKLKKQGAEQEDLPSKNYFKLLRKRRKLSTKISNIQKDYIHQITSFLVKTKPEKIIIEDLNVKGMLRNKHLAKWISFNQFYRFKSTLKYKCEFYGIELVIADRFFPSTQTCSYCDRRLLKEEKLKLSNRTFVCPDCGLEKNRDFNAAKNLCNYL
jgi:putative transposase